MDDYVKTVIDRAVCNKHKALQKAPCWTVLTASGNLLKAVCNKRAVGAGFNGRVNPKSIRRI